MTMRCAVIFAGMLLPAFPAWAQYTLGDCLITVIDESGKPIAGAQVQCVNWDNDRPRTAPLQKDERGITGADGKITFHNKYLGQSFARVQAGKLGGWFRLQDQKNGRNEQTVTVGLGRTVKGVVHDEHEEPIAGVMVLVDGCLPATVTDKDGNYAVPNMGVGYAHSFGYYKDGYAWAAESPREDMKSVDIALKKGSDVEGIVIGPDGRPVARANVNGGVGYRSSVQTDEKGRFRIVALPVNTKVKLTASLPTNEGYYLGGEVFVSFSEKPEKPVTIAVQRKEYQPKPVLHGRVVRADNGKPVTAGMLAGYTEHDVTSKPGATNQNGEFIIDNYSGGVYWISARPLNPVLYVVGGPVRVDFSNLAQEELVLKVDEGCCIRGRTMTEDGQPIANKWVMIQPWSGFTTMTQTRDNGVFVLSNLDGVGIEYTVSMTDDLGRTRSVKVGPMKKGETREGVELRMPVMVAPHRLRGVARNPQGQPLANVRIMPTYEHASGPSLQWPVTDDAGRFDIPVVTSGRVKISASTSVNVEVGGEKQDRQQYFKVLGNESFDLDASKDTDLDIVMELMPKTMLGGRVVDEKGSGIRAQLAAIKTESEREGASSDKDGDFFFYKTPDPPFLLEVMSSGYKARVQVVDRDIMDSTTKFAITLKQGPFAIGESVWSTVTDKPATDAGVKDMPLGAYIRQQEARYYHDAKPRPQPSADARPQPRFYTPRVRFIDAKGAPITRVVIQPLQSLPLPIHVLYKSTRGYAPKPQSNEDGIYNVTGETMSFGYGWVAWADGMGRVSPYIEQTHDPNTVVDIVMRPAGTIELDVFDADGKPAANIPVCSLDSQPEYDKTQSLTLGNTDESGKLRFEQIAPGAHAFMVGAFGINQRLIAFRLGDGESKTVVVKLTTDPADPAWLLQTWRVTRETNTPLPKIATDYIATLGAAPRAHLAAYVRTQLDLFVDTHRQLDGRERELKFLTALAVQLGDKETVPIFQRAIRADMRNQFSGRGPEYTAIGAMARATADMLGDDAVDFFSSVAGDETLSTSARLGAVQAFGRIGSKKSAAAYKKLRDTFRARPGAPRARESYTHAEKMLEAVYFYRVAFTWDFSNGPLPGMETMGKSAASVSEDYATGTLTISYDFGGAKFNLVRVGDEWMVKELENETMV